MAFLASRPLKDSESHEFLLDVGFTCIADCANEHSSYAHEGIILTVKTDKIIRTYANLFWEIQAQGEILGVRRGKQEALNSIQRLFSINVNAEHQKAQIY